MKKKQYINVINNNVIISIKANVSDKQLWIPESAVARGKIFLKFTGT